MKKSYTWVVVLVAVAGFYLWRYRRAPDLDLSSILVTDASGNSESLQSVLSDSSIVLFYASWCGPCLKEIRELKNAYSDYEQEHIRFFCVTDDPSEKIEVMRANMPESIIFLHTASLKELGVYTIPASCTVLNGKITHQQISALDWQRKKEILDSFNNN
jgi:thiol-disulfide isomerase/thioredoxin